MNIVQKTSSMTISTFCEHMNLSSAYLSRTYNLKKNLSIWQKALMR